MKNLCVTIMLLAAVAIAACEPHLCRFDPSCAGGIGGLCDSDRDCADGFCCTTDNCGGGMCTVACSHDEDCPDEMACEHEVCFFVCGSDEDCAEAMSCEHGNTICEWD
jgi:hypothetical protein